VAHALPHACAYARTLTLPAHARARTHARTHTHARKHTRTHTHIAHTRTHARARTHTHAHTRADPYRGGVARARPQGRHTVVRRPPQGRARSLRAPPRARARVCVWVCPCVRACLRAWRVWVCICVCVGACARSHAHVRVRVCCGFLCARLRALVRASVSRVCVCLCACGRLETDHNSPATPTRTHIRTSAHTPHSRGDRTSDLGSVRQRTEDIARAPTHLRPCSRAHAHARARAHTGRRGLFAVRALATGALALGEILRRLCRPRGPRAGGTRAPACAVRRAACALAACSTPHSRTHAGDVAAPHTIGAGSRAHRAPRRPHTPIDHGKLIAEMTAI
jgi:hypothetical protein